MKRDKKLKIENQRKIDSLKEQNEKEIEQAIHIKRNRMILTLLNNEIKRFKEEYLTSESESHESQKLNSQKSSRTRNKKSQKTIMNQKIKNTKSTLNMGLLKKNKKKTGIVLPKINTIFSKKRKN